MYNKQITFKQCGRCKKTLLLSNFSKNKTREDGHSYQCKNCDKQTRKHGKCIDCRKTKQIYTRGRCAKCHRKLIKDTNPFKYNEMCAQDRKRSGSTDYKKLKSCPAYLGIHVAEQVLSKVFKNIKVMPMHNPGYDFICNHGKKIDVKSSCIQKNKTGWKFVTKKNTKTDFFLCIAFDNRTSLTPLHLWLIPSNHIKNNTSVHISPSTLNKWNKFELDVSKTLQCCNKMKHH